MQEAVWMAVVVLLPPELEDAFIGRLAAYTAGAVSTRTVDGRVLLSVFLRSSDDIREAMEQGRRLMAEAGLADADCRLHTEEVEDGLWVERYQASLKPFPLGDRFMAYPNGRISAVSSRIPLLLVPGGAFGTGEHPTTRLCVEALERSETAGGRWLDLGCGTAILAMVAHYCGAAEVMAIDNDPVAVEVAAAVLNANGLSPTITLECSSIQNRAAGRWDGVVANISLSFLVSGAEELAGLIKPGGRLICSGFLMDDLDAVRAALSGAGLVVAGRGTSDPWAALVALKPGRSAP